MDANPGRSRKTKLITGTYTTLPADSGTTLICNSASPFTITQHSPTNQHHFDLMVINIGGGVVTIGGRTLGQYAHAHMTNSAGTAWVTTLGAGAESDPVYVASAASGVVKAAYDHSQAAHAPVNAQKNSDILKPEIEGVLTGTISSHTHSIAGMSHFEPLVNGDASSPEIMFDDDGDIIMVEVA